MDNNTAVERVVKTILSGIEKGTFSVGQKIPSQRELASLFGVSRMVIREAVKVLEGRDVLVSRRGSGIYVKQDHSETENFSLVKISDFEIREMWEMSKVIWESSISLIIANAEDEELQQLSIRVEEMNNNYSFNTSLQSKYIYETSFGMTVCELSHNKLLYRLMLELLKGTSDVDYLMVRRMENYKRLIEIDLHLVESLIMRDEQRSKFWARERNMVIDKVIEANTDFFSHNRNHEDK